MKIIQVQIKCLNGYQNAVIAVEDHRFEKHGGIDIIGTCRAIVTNITSFSLVEGGSTITQQLARNLYFTQEQSLTRKIAELLVAFDLEKNYSKDQILELYINTIYFGEGYYGIKEACEGYFDEMTLLAGIPNAPSVYSLNANPDLAKQRQQHVINAMKEYGYIEQKKQIEIKFNCLIKYSFSMVCTYIFQ